MFAKIENWLTLGNQYVAASLVYLGLAIMLGGSTLIDFPLALASNGSETACVDYVNIEGVWVTVPGCPVGTLCCEATAECLPEYDYICCEGE